jgi:hypothetical protein
MNPIKMLVPAIALAIVGSGMPAHAGCYEHPVHRGAGTSAPLPSLPSLPSQARNTTAAAAPSIIGLWHAIHTVGGQVFFTSLDQWNAGGTELEMADGAPAAGNICLGVWTQGANNAVSLFHVGYTFDNNGNSTGFFTLTATDTVNAKNDTFTGPFVANFYDNKYNLLQTFSGQTVARRLGPS